VCAMQPPSLWRRQLLWVALAALGAACDPTLFDPGDLLGNGAGLKAQPPRATIVLAHGMGGFRNVGPLDYWFHVPGMWRAQGARVYVASATPFASTERRAKELRAQLESVPGPFILVGHSQGALDVRYLVSRLDYARRTVAVVTIAGPHQGTPLADVLLGHVPGSVMDAANVLLGVLGWSLDGAQEVTTRYMTQVFNPTVPDVDGVRYWSVVGRASPLGHERGTGWLHAMMTPGWTLLKAMGKDSDGAVPIDSQRWGEVVATIPADHIGEVNQPFGETPGWHALKFYAELMQKMHDAGW